MSHTRRATILLTLSLLLSSTGCSSARHQEAGRTYDEKNSFSIILPDGWTNRGELMGAFMFAAGPTENGFAVNFNVNVQKDAATAQEVLPKLKEVLPKITNDYRPMSEGFIEIDGKKAYFLSGTFQMGPQRLQNLQYGVPSGNGRFYTLTFTAPQDTFEKHRASFEKMAQSARID